jgi:hypothetical protein
VASSRAELVGGLIGWVNADAADSAIAGLAQIAEALGVDDPKGDTRKSASRLREHLATRDGESLLVFDNASRPEELNEFLGPAGRAKVVVTTTRADFVDAPSPSMSAHFSAASRCVTCASGLVWTTRRVQTSSLRR